MQTYCLLGDPIAHSLSPAMMNLSFQALGMDCRYDLRVTNENSIEDRVRELREEGAAGWNCTMPCKHAMVPLCDRLSTAARIGGAVNTVKNENGILTGHTTDGTGFMNAMADAGLRPRSTAYPKLPSSQTAPHRESTQRTLRQSSRPTRRQASRFTATPIRKSSARKSAHPPCSSMQPRSAWTAERAAAIASFRMHPSCGRTSSSTISSITRRKRLSLHLPNRQAAGHQTVSPCSSCREPPRSISGPAETCPLSWCAKRSSDPLTFSPESGSAPSRSF